MSFPGTFKCDEGEFTIYLPLETPNDKHNL